MTEIEDIRWHQRLHNYEKAVDVMLRAAAAARAEDARELDQVALIKCFEMAHELAWNLLKDFLTAQGEVGLFGSRNATRLAVDCGVLPAGPVWMDMIDCRNVTVHAYDEAQAREIARQILETFVAELVWLRERFASLTGSTKP